MIILGGVVRAMRLLSPAGRGVALTALYLATLMLAAVSNFWWPAGSLGVVILALWVWLMLFVDTHDR